jgi:poly(A) polymerase
MNVSDNHRQLADVNAVLVAALDAANTAPALVNIDDSVAALDAASADLGRSDLQVDADAVARINGKEALNALLLSVRPDLGLRIWRHHGLLDVLLPEIAALDLNGRVSRNGHALHKDNVAHSFVVAAQTPARIRVRLAGLFHDVGKASTRRIDAAGVVSFHGHENVGVRITVAALTRLGFTADDAADVAQIAVLAGRAHAFTGNWTDSAVRRVMTDAGDLFDDVLALAAADVTSRRPVTRARVAALVATLAAQSDVVRAADARAAVRSVLDGSDVMRILELRPGRDVGVAMSWLLERAHSGSAHRDPLQEAEALRAWWAAHDN